MLNKLTLVIISHIYTYKIIVLHSLHSYNVIFQLYLSKVG